MQNFVQTNNQVRNMFVCFVLMISGYVAYGEVNRKYTLPLCSGNVRKHYIIDNPQPCATEGSDIQQIKVDVTLPIQQSIDIEAYMCRKKMEVFECTYYFWGTQSCLVKSKTYVSVTTAECISAERTFQSPLGTLVPVNENSLSTSNILIPKFTWPVTNNILVENVELSYTKVIADVLTGKISHVSLPRIKCENLTTLMTCLTSSWRLISPKVDTSKCHNPKTIKNASMEIYPLEGGNLYKIQKAQIVTTRLIECDEVVTTCLSKELKMIVCTPTGYIIHIKENVPVNAENIKTLKLPTEIRILEAAVASTALASKLQFSLIKKDIKQLLCNNNRATLVALQAAQKSTPSAVLSLLLGRKAFASYRNGVLQELECQNVTAILQPNLTLNNKISKRLLFNVHLGTSTIQAQWTTEGFLTQQLKTTIRNSTKRTFVFFDSLLYFINNTLSKAAPSLRKISLNQDVSFSATNIEFDELETIQELHDAVEHEETHNDQALRNLIDLTTEKFRREGVEIGEYIKYGHLNDHGSFAEIFQPKGFVWSVIIEILDYVSRCWSIILSSLITITLWRRFQNWKDRRAERKNLGNCKEVATAN